MCPILGRAHCLFPTDLLELRARPRSLSPVDPRKLRSRCFLPEEDDEEDAEGIITIPPSTIHVRDLTITDEDFAPVVSGASFQIKSGECVSIVGDDVEATRALLRAWPSVLVIQNASRAPLP